MATNSNTKQMLYQANSFNKGMDADTTDMLISDESYRLAKNLRYITDAGESTGELRLIEGAEEIEYSPGDSSDYLSEDYTVRAFNSMRNVGALVCQKEDDSWAVFRMDSDGSKWTTQLIFGWCTDALSQDVKLSTVLKYEDTDQLQLYIADGQHQLMKINLYDTTRSSDIRYITGSQVFFELSDVKYNLVLTGGLLESGLVQYSYKLYNDNNTSTQIAPLSLIKEILNSFKEIGPIGLPESTQSSMGLQIYVDVNNDLSQIYNKILLFRINYLINGQQPKIQLIYDGKLNLNGNRFTYSDFGTTSLLQLTVEEFNSLSGIYIQPKVIEAKNNILFAGNITYDVDILDEDYLNIDFRAFSSGDIVEGTDDPVTRQNLPRKDQNAINRNLYFTEQYNEDDWRTIEDPDTNSIGGWGENIDWKFGVFEENIINELPSKTDINKYETDTVKIKNYENPQTRIVGLRHDEIYRYGIILYSKSGTKYPVKWIADIRTPSLNSRIGSDSEWENKTRSLSRIRGDILEISYILYPIFKIHANVLDANKIAGYEIVRVHRTENDMATIAQGVIASTVQSTVNGQKDRNQVSSSGMPFVDHVYYSTKYPGDYERIDSAIAETAINVLQFYSPEISYLQDDIMLILKSNSDFYLQCLYPISPITGYGEPRKVMVSSYEPINPKSDLLTQESLYPCLCKNMYSYENMSYKLFYVLTSPRQQDVDDYIATQLSALGECRFKWYMWEREQTHFPKKNAQPGRDYIYNNLDGLNVYKLHRTRNHGIPYDIVVDADDPHTESVVTDYEIKDASLIQYIDFNKLIEDGVFSGRQHQSQVDDYTAFHCIAPYVFGDFDHFNISYLLKPYTSHDANPYLCELIATCDPSLAIRINNDVSGNIIKYYYDDDNILGKRGDTIKEFEYSILCNIRRNIVPYGGFSKYSRDNSIYVQHGYYYDLSDENNINKPKSIFDGDTVVSEFEFVTAHKWDSATHYTPRCTIVCQVAVESSINISLDHGEKFSNNTYSNSTLVQVQPCNFNDLYILYKPSYLYNTAYSIDPQLLQVASSTDIVQNSLKNIDYRVHYSNPASNNQASDPWLIFQPLNYLDVDNSHGPITELRTFKDLLIFWLEKAMGVLSVNERVQIATDSNLPLILGTGGVLERYDYLTTANGMKKNQHADTQSDHTLYWWDYDNNTICAYSRGSVPVQLSKVKSVQNILNRAAKNDKLTQSNISTGIYPLLTYDKKYNEVLFKIGQLEKLDKVGIHKGDAGLKDSDNDNVLVYNEQQAQFSSIYEIDPQCYFNIEQKLFFMNREDDKYNMYRWNSGSGEQSLGFNGMPLLPYLKYVINNQKGAVKVYDNVEFAGRIPSGDTWDEESQRRSLYMSTLDEHVKFEFNTPLKQVGKIDGTKITNRQLDFKFAIPRNGYQDKEEWITKEYGDRMRGKTMQCEIYSDINSLDFSLLYILTKYRMSWG